MSRSTALPPAWSATKPKLDRQNSVPILTTRSSRTNLSSDEFNTEKSEENAIIDVIKEEGEDALQTVPDSPSPASKSHGFAPNLPFMKKKVADDEQGRETKEAKKKLKEAKREEKKLIKETKRAAKQSRKIALAE